VEEALNKISLSEMSKTFAGMSKAIDSDAERAFFQSAQPSLKRDEEINVEVLREMKDNLESLKRKSKAKLQEFKGIEEIDQKALDWANKNPNDPRSIEIKKRLGM
jgi:hypothetical protein